MSVFIILQIYCLMIRVQIKDTEASNDLWLGAENVKIVTFVAPVDVKLA